MTVTVQAPIAAGAPQERRSGLVIKLLRHGESASNVGLVELKDLGDYRVPLTARGWEQSREAGRSLGAAFFEEALVYGSPYLRARQTLQGVLEGAGVPRESVRVYEDPRLREVDHGYSDVPAQAPLRETHGWFYYRYKGGESPADCYDRTSQFLEGMMRQLGRRRAGDANKVLILSHGLTMRCFVMRFLHLTVEQFDAMDNPDNGAIVTIAPFDALAEPDPEFRSDRWGVQGLQRRPDGA